jgi:hypothetical protein
VHWLHMVPWQTPLFLLSAPGIDTGNRYESIWLTNRFGSQKPQHYLLNRHLINLTNSPCCYLESSFAIAGNTSTAHCSYQCINSSYQISISFRVPTSSPNKKKRGFSKNPTKLQLGCSLDNQWSLKTSCKQAHHQDAIKLKMSIFV